MKRNLLVIGHFRYELTKQKGNLKLMSEYNFNGYFSTVILWGFNLNIGNEYSLENSVRLIETPKKFNNKILDLFYYLVVGIRLIRKYDISIIRSTDPYFRGLVARVISWFTKIPCCISIHADFDKRNELEGANNELQIFGSWKISKWLELFNLRHTDLVLPIRKSLAANYVKQGINKNKIRVIPHGIDFNEFLDSSNIDIHEQFSIQKSQKIISVACRLKKENYIYDVLKIAKELKKRNMEDVIIVVAGGGDEYDNLKREIAVDELENYIKILGFQSQDVVASIRKKSYLSLCLMAGFSLIEACACARPVIAYDVEWHSELVKDNETGFLITEKDTDGVFEKILLLVENPELALAMGEKAKKLAFENHKILDTEKIKVDCYNELLKIKTEGKENGQSRLY